MPRLVRVTAVYDGEIREGTAHCVNCARGSFMADPRISWWEVFDMQGNMIDSADMAAEDGLPPEECSGVG